MSGHQVRAHSKFSASGSERWLNCAASVALEEASPPSKDSPWSLEGTKAHKVLEWCFTAFTTSELAHLRPGLIQDDALMIRHALKMVRRVLDIQSGLSDAELLIEARVYNTEIHSEMFGTVDAALIEVFGTLHVFDYKYGQGHIVDPTKNTQLIQYALGIAERYDWAFSDVVLHIDQPRGSAIGFKSWSLTIADLKGYRDLWKKGVQRIEAGKSKPFPGSWCHWCRAKTICPAKVGAREEKVVNRFENVPLDSGERNLNAKKENTKEPRETRGEGQAKSRKGPSGNQNQADFY